MTERIVDFLDALVATVGAIDERYCLVEKREMPYNGQTTNIPYKYVGNGNYRPVEVDGGSVSYWRLVNNISFDVVDGNSAIKNLQATYPIRYVAMVKRDANNPLVFSQDVANVLEGRNKDLQTQLQAKNVNITVNSIDTNTPNIWSEEFTMPLKEPDYKRSLVMIDITVTVIAKRECWQDCDNYPDILQGFPWCEDTAATVDRLTDEQKQCLSNELCGEPDPVTEQINGVTIGTAASGTTNNQLIENTLGTQVGTSANPSIVGDATVENSDGSYSATVKAEGTLVLPNITFTDSDGTTSSIPSVQDITATPCTPPSLSISASNTTPTYGDTVTITVTATGITPTSYSFTVNGNITTNTTVQASNTFSYVVDTLNPTIYIQATDGSGYSATVYNGLTVSSITEAGNFITALETATSDTMGGRQKDAVNRLAWRFQGNGTTNSTDLWTLLTATNAVMYISCPNDDSTAYFDGYAIDFLDHTHVGTYVNMVSGDITVDGVTGGGSKYFNLGVQPADFSNNDVMLHRYRSKYEFEYLVVEMGVHEITQSTNGISVYGQLNGTQSIVRVNSSTGSFIAKQSITGVLSFGMNPSTGRATLATNGTTDADAAYTPSTAIAEDIYGHGAHNASTGAVFGGSNGTFAGWAVTPWLSADAYLDFCEAWDEFNQIVITDGRKCRIS